MTTRKKRPKRDIERDYPAKQLVAKLRRLADVGGDTTGMTRPEVASE